MTHEDARTIASVLPAQHNAFLRNSGCEKTNESMKKTESSAAVMHVKPSSPALFCPRFSLRTNELPLEVIVVTESLTPRLFLSSAFVH